MIFIVVLKQNKYVFFKEKVLSFEFESGRVSEDHELMGHL
jgi:hypothetical protein